jgi:hypothetical protein
MINLDNLKFVDGDFLNSESLSEMIYENEGSFTQTEQSMSFDVDGKDVTLNYEVYVEGTIDEESGDYWTPGSCDVELTDVDVTINEVFIDGELVKLDNEVLSKIEKLIEKQLKQL